MTKRTKLLSLVVAAALCLVAGFAMMFSSTAKADAVIPDVTAPSVVNAYEATSKIKFQNETAATGDWIFAKMTIAQGTTAARGSDNNGFISTVSTDGTYSHVSGENHIGTLHNVEPIGVASLENLFTATDADKEIVFAVNLTNGDLSIKNGDSAWVTASKYAGVEALEGGKYFVLGTNSSNVAGIIKNIVMYDEEGNDLGLTTTLTEVAPTIDASSIAGKDFMSRSSFWVANKNATTSKWIFLEWDNDEGNTTARTGGGWTYGVAIGDETLDNVTATADNIWHDFGTYYFGTKSAGKHVKVVVNTATGAITAYIDGVADGSATRPVEGLTNFKFRAGTNSAYSCNSIIYNFKAYDGEGNDLEVDTNMSEYKEITIEYGTPGVVETFQRWNISYTTKDDQGEECDYTFALAAGATIQVNGEDFELVSGISCAYQGLLLVPSAAFGYEKVSDVPGMHVVLPAEATGLVNDIEFYLNGLANGSLTAPQVGTFATEEGALGAQGGANQMRWIGDMNFVNGSQEPIAAFALNNVLAKKGGVEDVVLKFTHAGGATQLFYLEFNHTEVAWTMNDWYLLEAGTMLGKEVVLSEDYVIAISGTTFKWFPADKVMNITYEGADAGSNPTTFSYGDTTALAAPADIAGKETLGWYCGDKKVESLADVANTAVSGDFTLTARYSDKVVFDGVLAMGGQVGALNRFILNADNFIVSAADGSQTFNITENIGTINVLKNGTDAATLSFVFSGGYHIVNNLAQFGLEEGASIEEIPFQWFLIEEGTIFGGYVIGEDTVVRVNGASLIILPADHEFTITYEGADAGSNPTSFAFSDDEITLADPAPVAGKVFAGWYVDGVKVEVINPAACSANVTLTAKFVTEVTLKDYVEIGAQTNFDRYLVDAEDIVFFDGTNDIPATFDLGTIAALDMEGNPINIVFVKAADANGTYQLIQSTVFGQDVIADVARAAYLIEAGTVIGDYILAEDIVLIVDGDNGAALMPVDYEFAISYENVREATNGNATSYAIDDTIELANLEKAGMTFLGWFDGETQVTEIAFPAFYGDLTLTAKWAQADFIKMNGEIMPAGMLVVNFYAVVENLENVSITYNGQPGMPGVLDANKSDAVGLPVYKFSAMVLAWQIDADTTAVILSGADQVASFTGAPVEYLESFLDSQDAELKALVANFIAYAADMDAQMNGSTEIDVPQAATLATIPEVGYGELGMKDDANKFDAPALVSGNPVLVFNTNKTGDLIVKINGEEYKTVAVSEGKIAINLGELALTNVIGAKLTVEVYQGTTKLGNTAVINVAAVMADLYEEATATVNMVARILAVYNALAAYIAD